MYALTAAYLQSLFHDVRFCICAQVTAGTFVTGVLLQLRYRVTVNLDCRFGDYEFVRPFLASGMPSARGSREPTSAL